MCSSSRRKDQRNLPSQGRWQGLHDRHYSDRLERAHHHLFVFWLWGNSAGQWRHPREYFALYGSWLVWAPIRSQVDHNACEAKRGFPWRSCCDWLCYQRRNFTLRIYLFMCIKWNCFGRPGDRLFCCKSDFLILSRIAGVPIIYGVLNCLTEEQALHRYGIKSLNLIFFNYLFIYWYKHDLQSY